MVESPSLYLTDRDGRVVEKIYLREGKKGDEMDESSEIEVEPSKKYYQLSRVHWLNMDVRNVRSDERR